jgi:hypothetical protein
VQCACNLTACARVRVVIVATVLAIIVGCSLPYIPVLNTYLSMRPLPSIYWAYFVG